MSFWKNKKVLVTGGTGFIGSHVAELLVQEQAKVTVTTLMDDIENISDMEESIQVIKANLTDAKQAMMAADNKDIILNLASRVAGIQYNINHPATMLGDNIIIVKNILDAALKNNIDRILITSSACVYPNKCKIPTPESEGFQGEPEPTNAGYGWGKRISELLGKFYAEEFAMKVAIARPYNAYGPRDNFNPNTSHVIPGLIKRIYDGEDPLVVWGSGKQSRAFLYVEDFARGLLDITEKYPEADPINIGTDEEITIADLAKLTVELSNKKPKIVFDKSKPDGQPRRNCDTAKAKNKVNFQAKINLREGLNKTIKWYEQHLLS